MLPPIDICPYCGANEVPGCLHVLWDCSAFADVRVLPAPECPLAKRLGWDLHGSLNQELLRQMGQIRQLEAQKRLRELHQQQRLVQPSALLCTLGSFSGSMVRVQPYVHLDV